MEIRPIQNQTTFKSYTSSDIYRLEQKIDQLNNQLDDGSLHDFYKDLPKTRRLPMPLGIPPYVMAGMPAPMMTPPRNLSGMPPIMGMGGMYGMPPIGMPPIGAMGMPPMGYPPPNSMPMPASKVGGQLPYDTFKPRAF